MVNAEKDKCAGINVITKELPLGITESVERELGGVNGWLRRQSAHSKQGSIMPLSYLLSLG